MRKAIIFVLAFLLLLPLTKADTYLTDCAVLNIPLETYYLTQDIINYSSTDTCMLIPADNVVLDCQGHTIDGVDNANSYGIYVYRSSETITNITIKNCVVTDWAYGIEFWTSDFNTLLNITSNSNYYFGIDLYRSNSNNLLNITANYNSRYGINFVYSSFNTLKNSIIQDNGYYGLSSSAYIPEEGGNLIYNNLFNNTNNFASGAANNWNTTRQTGTRIYSFGNEIGGNYWTNPTGNGYSDTCIDSDKDGFCDDPYVLNANNADYLALSDEYSPPSTTTLPPVSGVPLLSRTLVGIAIGFGVLAFMLKTLFDIREPKKVVEYFIALAVIVLTVISLIVLFV